MNKRRILVPTFAALAILAGTGTASAGGRRYHRPTPPPIHEPTPPVAPPLVVVTPTDEGPLCDGRNQPENWPNGVPWNCELIYPPAPDVAPPFDDMVVIEVPPTYDPFILTAFPTPPSLIIPPAVHVPTITPPAAGNAGLRALENGDFAGRLAV